MIDGLDEEIDIEKVQYKSGLLNNTITFFPRNAKRINFKISFQYKDQIYPFVRELEKKTHII
jgi:hypothetical protein